MIFDLNWKFKDIAGMEPFNSVSKYLIYGGYQQECPFMELKLSEVQKELNWNPATVIRGLERVEELGDLSENVHCVYSEEECEADPAKRDVSVTFIPAKTEKKKKDIMILVPGGAYVEVCAVCEGYPVAARLNELGYSAFILNYRVNENGILPKPIDDLAAAVRYIRDHAESFDVEPERYVVCGFSAGGHLITEWGTDNHGYMTYGLPKPAAMFPVYPEVGMDMFAPEYEEEFRLTMLGDDQSEARKREYSVNEHVSENYPPCYICLCKDDAMVPVENSLSLCRALDQAGVPYRLELDEKGGHGFGDGQGTDAAGWIDRAIEYYESL
ncbi:MAG: alpha/beta hydrolase [Eubacteriales bacterium]|nr:alpha/beta hydrolase [Eubacteriales bacterium]